MTFELAQLPGVRADVVGWLTSQISRSDADSIRSVRTLRPSPIRMNGLSLATCFGAWTVGSDVETLGSTSFPLGSTSFPLGSTSFSFLGLDLLSLGLDLPLARRAEGRFEDARARRRAQLSAPLMDDQPRVEVVLVLNLAHVQEPQRQGQRRVAHRPHHVGERGPGGHVEAERREIREVALLESREHAAPGGRRRGDQTRDGLIAGTALQGEQRVLRRTALRLRLFGAALLRAAANQLTG